MATFAFWVAILRNKRTLFRDFLNSFYSLLFKGHAGSETEFGNGLKICQ